MPAVSKSLFGLKKVTAFGWVFFLACYSYILLFWFHKTDGHFAYSMDDTYIHLALAKNWAEHGIWGMTPYEFTHNSSGLLYTFCLGLWFKIFVVSEYIPLLFNLLGSLALICFIGNRYLDKEMKAEWQNYGIMALEIIAAPLPFSAVSGMEHIWQILINLLFIGQASLILEKKQYSNNEGIALVLLSVCCATIRYEGVFVVGLVSALLLARKIWKPALLGIILAAIPICFIGIYSINNGGFFLPNSVLLKARKLKFDSISEFMFSLFGFYILKLPAVAFLLTASVWIFFRRYLKKQLINWKQDNIQNIILGLCCVFYILTSFPGQRRYEMWLIGFGLLVVFRNLNFVFPEAGWRKYRVLRVGTVLFFISPFVWRGRHAFEDILFAGPNIYGQQRQMARFVNLYYQDKTVALNDIGCVSYYNNIRIFDIWGLANNTIAKAKIENHYSGAFFDSLARSEKVELLMMYDFWFDSSYTRHFIPITHWRMDENHICGSDKLSFYAPNEQAAEVLRQNLKSFSDSLPNGTWDEHYPEKHKPLPD